MRVFWHKDGDVLLVDCGGKAEIIRPKGFTGRNAAVILNQMAKERLKRAHVEIEAVTFS